jgi:hypothetical protein
MLRAWLRSDKYQVHIVWFDPLGARTHDIPHSMTPTITPPGLTRRGSLVEQELLTLLKHLSSLPVFSGVRVTRSLVLCVVFCRSLFVPLSLIFLLSVLLRFMDSDYLPLVSLSSSNTIESKIMSCGNILLIY